MNSGPVNDLGAFIEDPQGPEFKRFVPPGLNTTGDKKEKSTGAEKNGKIIHLCIHVTGGHNDAAAKKEKLATAAAFHKELSNAYGLWFEKFSDLKATTIDSDCTGNGFNKGFVHVTLDFAELTEEIIDNAAIVYPEKGTVQFYALAIAPYNEARFKPTILHEVGHTLGLADTYFSPDRKGAVAVAGQPVSLMMCSDIPRRKSAGRGHSPFEFIIRKIMPDDERGLASLVANIKTGVRFSRESVCGDNYEPYKPKIGREDLVYCQPK